MGKRIKITERQLGLITKHISESKSPINESKKELVLGVAMLMGLNLSGQNKAIADNALSDPNILLQIDSVLATPEIEDIASRMEDMGLRDALNQIKRNKTRIQTNYANYASQHNIDPEIFIYTGE